MKVLPLCLCLVMALGACSISAKFTSTKAQYPKSTRSVNEIEIFMGGDRPDRDYMIVGIISTDWLWKGMTANQGQVFQAMRIEAAKFGLDGVLDVECAGSGIKGQGLCTGKGFVYTGRNP